MSVYLIQRLRVPSSNDSVSMGSEAALLPGFLLGLGSPPVVIDETRSRVASPTADETKDLITATADHCYWSERDTSEAPAPRDPWREMMAGPNRNHTRDEIPL